MARWAYELYSSKGSAISESVRNQLLSSFSKESIPPWATSSMPGFIPDEYGYLVSKKIIRSSNDREVTGTAYGDLGGGSGYSGWMHYSPDLDWQSLYCLTLK
ncbi:MAG: hypothetical protein CM1200mP37_6830 [Chloroflexota bacterium]|nr:MAG: hypothetical protein CM1200mP37_6830 [Chloroflexota bacterium]